MRVLVIEDHFLMRFALRTFFSLANDVELVGETEDPEEALNLVEELRPDLVILDLRLGAEMRGIQLCRELKNLDEPPKTLIYTEYNSPDHLAELIIAGANSYVHKGVDHLAFMDALQRTHAGESVWMLENPVEEAERSLRNGAREASLTRREEEVLNLILRRYSNAEIADNLFISIETVKTHTTNVLKKLGKKTRRDFFQE